MKILIVDDSQTEITLLKHLFEAEKDMQVIGTAKNGREAIQLTKKLKPDLITMDILMPVMDGLEATRAIMAEYPTPIVVISGGVKDESLNITFKALEAGALSVIEKPSLNQLGSDNKRMVDTVRAMSEIKIVKRRFQTAPKELLVPSTVANKFFEIIAIGTSVGGPQALKAILSQLPENFPVPIVIVQHMVPGFIDGFAKWLNTHTKLSVQSASQDEPLSAGTVYFAPDNFHMEIIRKERGPTLYANLTKNQSVSGFCPSATVLFNSVAQISGKKAIGILLTGMGNDGAQGLLSLKKAHGHTLIQDQESTVVFGMAGVAQSLGAVDKVVNLVDMAPYLIKIFKDRMQKR